MKLVLNYRSKSFGDEAIPSGNAVAAVVEDYLFPL
jgi:hypothetical protein